jgi:hypothetical protein
LTLPEDEFGSLGRQAIAIPSKLFRLQSSQMGECFKNILGDSISEFVSNLQEDVPYFHELKSYLRDVIKQISFFF